jgi:hypothetical protein
MPFDAANIDEPTDPLRGPGNETVSVLIETGRLLAGDNWMQGSWINDEGRLCLIGAVKWAMLETGQPLHRAEEFLAEAITGSATDENPCNVVIAFNDAPGHTFADIEAILHKALEAARAV